MIRGVSFSIKRLMERDLALFDLEHYEGMVIPTADQLLKLRSLNLTYGDEYHHYMNAAPIVETLGVPESWFWHRIEESWGAASDGWCDSLKAEDGYTLHELKRRHGLDPETVLERETQLPIFGEVCDDGIRRYASVQFERWESGGRAMRDYVWPCVEIFRSYNLTPEEAVWYIYDARADYGFFTPAELLKYGDSGVKSLVLADATEYAVKKRTERLAREWREPTKENVPDPKTVTSLIDSSEGLIDDQDSWWYDSKFSTLAKKLNVSEALLISRAKAPKKRYFGSVPESHLISILDLSRDALRESGLASNLVVSSIGQNGEKRFDAFQFECEHIFSPRHERLEFGDEEYVVSRPFREKLMAFSLVSKLLGEGYEPRAVATFLTEPSPWFGFVAPLDYAAVCGVEGFWVVVRVSELTLAK